MLTSTRVDDRDGRHAVLAGHRRRGLGRIAERFLPEFDGGESHCAGSCSGTIYLNDDFGAGETEFLYQQRRIVPKAGALLIAPTAFTHTHRGNMPRSGAKYIATSWILFRRAESMYGPPPGTARP